MIFKIDTKRINDIIEGHGFNNIKKSVEQSQKRALEKVKTITIKDITSNYNIKKSDVSKKINIEKDFKAISNKDVISSPYSLVSKDKRIGAMIGSFKNSSLEDGAVQVRKFVKNNRFKIRKRRKKKKGTGTSEEVAITIEIKKGERHTILPGYAIIRTANNYTGIFARGKYTGKKFEKGNFKNKQGKNRLSRIWTISSGNMFNEAVKSNKEKINTLMKSGFEKEYSRLIKLWAKRYQKH